MSAVKQEEKKRISTYILLVILGITFILHSKGIQNEILYGWDDGEYIQEASVQNFKVKKFFSEYYLGMYQPLAVMSLSLNYQVAKDSASAYHSTNLLLHLLNLLVVFFLVRRLSGNLHISVFVTTLMAIHPMHTEAIAWIAARSTLLFSLFYLLGLWMYLRYIDGRKNWRFLALTVLFFALALFSKSMAVTFPLVLFLVDFYRGRKMTVASVMEKAPLLILSVIFGLVSVSAAKDFGHISGLAEDYTLPDRFFLLCYSIILYIGKAVVPIKLQAIYSYPLRPEGFFPWVYYASPVFLAGIVLMIVYSKKIKKELVFGFLFFLLTISVVLPLYWSRVFIAGERYTYLTYIGLFYAFGWGLKGLEERYRFIRSGYVMTVFAVYVVFCMAITSDRINDWKNTHELLTSTVKNTYSRATGAEALFYRGNFKDMAQDFRGATSDYNLALKLNPNHVLALNNRGIIKGMTNDLEGALEDFNLAIELRPGYAEAYYNRGLVFLQQEMISSACENWLIAKQKGFDQAEKMLARHCR